MLLREMVRSGTEVEDGAMNIIISYGYWLLVI